MNRSEVVAEVAERTSMAKNAVDNALKTFTDVVAESLGKGETVTFRGFGRFEVRLRRAMTKPHPQTGEPMDIPEKLSVAFLPSELLKDELNRAA